MLKALVKKDFSKFFDSLTNTKNSKKKNKNTNRKGGVVGMIFLWIFVFLSIGFAFFGISDALGSTLLAIGFDWLYYCILSMIAFALAILINGFMASSILFNAKDNELLLSMPIPSGYILLSRMIEIYVLSFIYSAVVILPAFIQRCILLEKFDGINLIFCFIVLILMAFSETAVSAVLGWIISAISKKVKHKSIVTVALTVAFLGVYYYFQFNSQKYIAKLVENSFSIGEKIESNIFALPVVKTGYALSGDVLSLLACFAMTAVVFAVVYYVLSRTFIKVATSSDKVIQRKYDAKGQAEVKLASPRKALLRKEFARFVGSPTYMLNCGLGVIMTIAASVIMIVKKAALLEKINSVMPFVAGSFLGNHFYTDIVPLLGMVMIFFFIGTIDISTPSISLEGKNLWILKTLPADPIDIFTAKQNLEIYIAVPTAVVFVLAYAYVFSLEWNVLVIMLCTSYMYIRCHAAIGLMLDLKMPKLDWTNEAVPIKQSLQVLIAMLGPWLFAAIVGGVYYFFLKDIADATTMMLGLLVVFALCTRFVVQWINTKGAKLFMAL